MFQNNWNILRLCWEQFSLFWSTSQALYLGEIQPPPKYLHASNPLRFLPQKGVVAPQIDFSISSPPLGFGLRRRLGFSVVSFPNPLAVESEEATRVQWGSNCQVERSPLLANWSWADFLLCREFKENTSDMKSFALIGCSSVGHTLILAWWILNKYCNTDFRNGSLELVQTF